jgi:hypothetical protein
VWNVASPKPSTWALMSDLAPPSRNVRLFGDRRDLAVAAEEEEQRRELGGDPERPEHQQQPREPAGGPRPHCH